MAEETMKVTIISRETIKPSSPTPSHLKSYKLSFLDQLQPTIYMPIVYFYAKKNDHVINTTTSSVDSQQTISQQLKKSLSESLVRFYPISGRINNNSNTSTVECIDEGTQYIEARFDGADLSTFLEHPPADPALLQQFFPAACESAEAGAWPLLQVQSTYFGCGGLALGVSVSHKLADAVTMHTFMKSWAATSSSSSSAHQKVITNPVLRAASHFPPRDDILSRLKVSAPKLKAAKGVQKRFVFDKPKLVDLKAKLEGDGVQEPSRVEAVVALIAKCMILSATSRSNTARGGEVDDDVTDHPKKFVLIQAVNLRRKVEPPLPDNLLGNFVGSVVVEAPEELVKLPRPQHVADELRKGMREFAKKEAKRLGGDNASEVISESLKEIGELLNRENTRGLFFTSSCNAQLYEEVDFGWGKPIWIVTPVLSGRINCVTLMDTRGGGVEAWVSLSTQDMELFERDTELLAYSQCNPSVI